MNYPFGLIYISYDNSKPTSVEQLPLQPLSRSRLQQTFILLVDGSETNPGAEEATTEVSRI